MNILEYSKKARQRIEPFTKITKDSSIELFELLSNSSEDQLQESKKEDRVIKDNTLLM